MVAATILIFSTLFMYSLFPGFYFHFRTKIRIKIVIFVVLCRNATTETHPIVSIWIRGDFGLWVSIVRGSIFIEPPQPNPRNH